MLLIKYFSKTIILIARLNYKYFKISKMAKENFSCLRTTFLLSKLKINGAVKSSLLFFI